MWHCFFFTHRFAAVCRCKVAFFYRTVCPVCKKSTCPKCKTTNSTPTWRNQIWLFIFPILTALQEFLTASLTKRLSENAERSYSSQVSRDKHITCHKLSGMLLNRSEQNGFYLFFPLKAQLNFKFGYYLPVLLIHMSMDTNTSLETGLFFVWTAQKCVFSGKPQLST